MDFITFSALTFLQKRPSFRIRDSPCNVQYKNSCEWVSFWTYKIPIVFQLALVLTVLCFSFFYNFSSLWVAPESVAAKRLPINYWIIYFFQGHGDKNGTPRSRPFLLILPMFCSVPLLPSWYCKDNIYIPLLH